MNIKRPEFPKRAVITGGMPYGNKALHFGHIGGVFIHADIFARFLRDRLGKDNVVFVSGTDCFGATISSTWEKQVESGDFSGSIEDYVRMNNQGQKAVLDNYNISLDLYAASALDRAGEIHKELSKEIFDDLYKKGALHLEETLQFFDDENNVFLNGRQVTGRCPIQGCKSEFAYADECSLGHQYNPAELIAPISALSNKRPSLVPVKNWYFDLVSFSDLLKERNKLLEKDEAVREGFTNIVGEFLKKPVIYVKKDDVATLNLTDLPRLEIITEDNKPSDSLVFENLDARNAACKYLTEKGIRYRTGKTLVPFRISGNVSWGIPVPEMDGAKDLTFWVWPESLWAPISFTKAYLEQSGSALSYEDFWKSRDAKVYQFLGEDNIYFYGIAEMGLFMALQNSPSINPENGQWQLPSIIANYHALYMGKKASSSSALKPPTAGEILNFYTAEQLRIHFMNASLGTKNVSFMPKAFMQVTDKNKNDFDAVLYEGNLLTNVFNRLVRSCFYTNQKYFGADMPSGTVTESIKSYCDETIIKYENHMAKCELDKTFELINIFLRDANKYFSGEMKLAGDDTEKIRQILVNSFHYVRVATTLLHPVAPEGCEMIREYLGADEKLWSWENVFSNLNSVLIDNHQFKFLEPRVDFFKKHDSQV